MNLVTVFNEMKCIETDNLILREITLNDVDDIFNIFSDKDVMKFYDVFPHNSKEESISLINKFIAGFKNKKMIRWGICLKNSSEIIGTCGFHSISTNNLKVEIGYELRKSEWNKRYMSEAINGLIKFAFEVFEVNRIEAFVEKENISSHGLLVKCGFQKEGVLREYEVCRGQLIDLIIFSMLNKDYRNKK
ncbi:GNAT family N-acetyltransferase [Clostridium cellulovorans]|uniref:GCN5-related N-acetyltransferase n=1 Tax=Clostridium cellulovorans (strain ATCC 35296 / DSM 3052 / OCM 3 / 743B) TaxID=573061 RepID=D9SKS4_CLOC7|nr:GNAT family protein [Clostridium cellulovorans]ADL53496.1 GCN5-related N-acetyltransferase [Clostridium cellulovorans 743B]